MNTKIAPSILASDWGNFESQVKSVESAGADMIHIDVMDGHFVPPITFGPALVETLRKVTKCTLDVHLMIENPISQINAFSKAGADIITVHQETCPHLHRVVQHIKELGKKAGVALNPATPVSTISEVIADVDLVCLMSVNPGWGGQKFIPSSFAKIEQVKSLANKLNRDSQLMIEVDGGINKETGKKAREAGANVLVAGTYVFRSDNFKQTIESLR